ncbi:NADH dehydrogenase [ubiquinone] 1 alpha subcomplex assembly factor 8 [Toxorhynchites rutilus septentrionalis]|uniref:NADH dehydrogenase [ubiquinone] 1 alpha subcomplex assembly factor 8 n=1 Tax=Toxorhynchites rutilus septentrionalis TaxID=329112 RepID=UPI002478D6AC|nr:NADH dehydrogenase [ubiquinone] 1 alpha subcomplex assembly factor 8 [Toxorhynchites rutilus septentrionalis]
MESVKKANQRLKNYPALLAKCSVPAAAYAACVTTDLNVSHKMCEKEFQLFKECLQKAASEMKTKL